MLLMADLRALECKSPAAPATVCGLGIEGGGGGGGGGGRGGGRECVFCACVGCCGDGAVDEELGSPVWSEVGFRGMEDCVSLSR
jgi:hypothetical protein